MAAQGPQGPVILHTGRTNDIAQAFLQEGLAPGLEGARIVKREADLGESYPVGFGSSDCSCIFHLFRFEKDPGIPGSLGPLPKPGLGGEGPLTGKGAYLTFLLLILISWKNLPFPSQSPGTLFPEPSPGVRKGGKMRRRFTPFLFALGVFLSGTAVAQTTYTYWCDAVNGNDKNGGTTPKTAFKSISMGVSMLRKGDTLYILPGVYSVSKTKEQLPIFIGSGPAVQDNIKIIAPYGPKVTILDLEKGNYFPAIRFRSLAMGAKISGLQIRNANTSTPGYWDCAFRLGSTSGQQYAAIDVEIFNCMFVDLYLGITVWSHGGGGCKIHDNLFVNCKNYGIHYYGVTGNNGVNIYNNTFVNMQAPAVFIYSATTDKAVIVNNICYKGAKAGFESAITNAANQKLITFENNCSYGNNPNYKFAVGAPSASNLTVDPLFVSPKNGDWHLRPNSPLIEKGWIKDFSFYGTPDFYGNASLFDYDGDGAARPDIGCHEMSDVATTLSGTWAIGQTVTLNHKGPAGFMAIDFMSRSYPGLGLPVIGSFITDPLKLLPIFLVGGSTAPQKLALPNNPFLVGVPVYIQSLYVRVDLKVAKAGNLLFELF